jgi:phosphoribosylanthranilate isomerase
VCWIASISEAVRRVRPFGGDVCSGLRTDGRLDEEKLVRFVAKLKEAR